MGDTPHFRMKPISAPNFSVERYELELHVFLIVLITGRFVRMFIFFPGLLDICLQFFSLNFFYHFQTISLGKQSFFPIRILDSYHFSHGWLQLLHSKKQKNDVFRETLSFLLQTEQNKIANCNETNQNARIKASS